MTDALAPHGPYIAAVAAALGPVAAEVEAECPPGDGPYARITVDPGRAGVAGVDGLYLLWNPYVGWSWLRDATGDEYEWMGPDVLNPLTVPVVAAPALVAEAVNLLLLARTERLPLTGEAPLGDAASVAALREAVARGDLDPGPADALAAYWPR